VAEKKEHKTLQRIPVKKCEYHGIVLFWCVHCN